MRALGTNIFRVLLGAWVALAACGDREQEDNGGGPGACTGDCTPPPECSVGTNTGCGEGHVCIGEEAGAEGRCAAGCFAHADCPPAQPMCEEINAETGLGTCKAGCFSNADCPAPKPMCAYINPETGQGSCLAWQATAVLSPTKDNAAHGSVHFKEEAGGVRVLARVSELTPGEHGFYIYEYGDCTASDASSVGIHHYNPHKAYHGKAGEGEHHVGDLPSLEAGANGVATLDVTLSTLSLAGEHSIVGRGLVVHAGPNNYDAHPTGNSGPRVACAVIQLNYQLDY